MGRVFVCGDTHGSLDILKLTGRYWPCGRTLNREDLLVILGDFGLVWSREPSRDETFWLDWLEARPWTTLFVDGNHENHDLLDAIEVSLWRSGEVHRLCGHPHIIHLMRGQVYECGEAGRWFVFGGARSQDAQWRTPGRSWWSREMPSAQEYAKGWERLSEVGFSVDYVFTHDTTSSRLSLAMPWYERHPDHVPPTDELTDYLESVDAALDADRLKAWYCGHYHLDRTLGDARHVLLYQQVVELGRAPTVVGAPGVFVPGVGYSVGTHVEGLEEAARLAQATVDEAAHFLGVDAHGCDLVFSHEDVVGLRRHVDAARKSELMRLGPKADIS